MKVISYEDLKNYVWDSLDLMRGNVNTNEAQQIFLRLFTLKVLNDNLDHPYLIPPGSMWSSLRAGGLSVAEKVNYAFKELEAANPKLAKVFTSFDFSTVDNDSMLKLLQHMDSFTINHQNMEWPDWHKGTLAKVAEDIVYKYLSGINQSAAPLEYGQLVAKLLSPTLFGVEAIYDPSAGVGTLLIETGKNAVDVANIKLEGQEADENIRAAGQMNLMLHGFFNSEIKSGDIIRKPGWIENGILKKYDYIVSNIPFGQRNWGREYAVADPYGRFMYGIPGVGNGELAYIMNAISSLGAPGKAVITVPPGVLFRGGVEQTIRQRIVENDLIETIISLPSGFFSLSSISFFLMIINKNKDNSDKGKIQFINAAENYRHGKGRESNSLKNEDINNIVEVYSSKTEIEQYSCNISIEEVEKHNWNLNPRKYMGQVEIESKVGIVEVNAEAFANDVVKKVKLGSSAILFRGILPPRQEPMGGQQLKYKIINLIDVQDGRILLNNCTPVDVSEIGSRVLKYEVYPGDVILSSRGTTIKVAVIPETDEKLVISNNFICIRLTPQFDPYYVKAYLESPIGLHFLQSHQYGTAVHTLNTKDVAAIKILDLPRQTQQIISSKIRDAEDGLIEQIAAAKQSYKDQYQEIYKEMGIDKFMTS